MNVKGYIALKAVFDPLDAASEIVLILGISNFQLIVHELEGASRSRTLSIHNVTARLTKQKMCHVELGKMRFLDLKGIRKVHGTFRRRGNGGHNVIITECMADESSRICRDRGHMGLNVTQQLEMDSESPYLLTQKEGKVTCNCVQFKSTASSIDCSGKRYDLVM